MRRGPTFRYQPAREADERLGELMLALSHRCGAMRPVDVDMAAWRADMEAYAALATPLSGTAYRRTPNGVNPENATTIRARLAAEGRAQWRSEGGWEARCDGRLRGLETNETTGAQIEKVIARALGAGNGWPVPRRLVESLSTGAAIPYEAVFLSDREITDDDRAATRRWAEEQGIDLGADG